MKYFRLLRQSYSTDDADLRAFTQAYLASVAAVDDCIGEIINALDKTRLKDNTIVVVTSDHGWNMGEKDYLFKNSLWEESARVPLIIRAPGVAVPGGIAEHPVSLIDVYPTLVDLCGLEGDTRKNNKGAALDGYSMRPFLEHPQSGTWEGPDGALTMVFVGNSKIPMTAEEKLDPARQHWSIRTVRWRYIRYSNGSEELYDHDHDPYEWTNLAGSPRLAEVKNRLYQKLLAMRGG